VIVGATVFAVLILLLLLAERGSSFLWQGGSAANAFYYCPPCDLRYPLSELADERSRTCPRGHSVEPVPRGFPFTTFFIVLCVAFIALGALLIATGNTPTP
jgi:hypothetical protein